MIPPPTRPLPPLPPPSPLMAYSPALRVHDKPLPSLPPSTASSSKSTKSARKPPWFTRFTLRSSSANSRPLKLTMKANEDTDNESIIDFFAAIGVKPPRFSMVSPTSTSFEEDDKRLDMLASPTRGVAVKPLLDLEAATAGGRPSSPHLLKRVPPPSSPPTLAIPSNLVLNRIRAEDEKDQSHPSTPSSFLLSVLSPATFGPVAFRNSTSSLPSPASPLPNSNPQTPLPRPPRRKRAPPRIVATPTASVTHAHDETEKKNLVASPALSTLQDPTKEQQQRLAPSSPSYSISSIRRPMRAPPPSPIISGASSFMTAMDDLPPLTPPLPEDDSGYVSQQSMLRPKVIRTSSGVSLRELFKQDPPKSKLRPKSARLPSSRVNLDWDREGNPWDDKDFGADVFGGGAISDGGATSDLRRRRTRTRSIGPASPSVKKRKRPSTAPSAMTDTETERPTSTIGPPRRRRTVLKKTPHAAPSILAPAKEKNADDETGFVPDALLSMRDLYEASLIPVWDQHGKKIQFGKLFEDQVTIVVFIRHFWCPMCQDYMKSIMKKVDPAHLEASGVKLVIIGCGDPAMIKAYNDRIFHSPYELYTDPKLKVHAAMGMTLKTLEGGPESAKGDYIRHGTLVGTLGVIGRAVTNMPPNVIIKKGGDIKQLGGEFVIGPGLRCRYAHRMQTTRDHAPIREVVVRAGVDFNPIPKPLRPFHLSPVEEDKWMVRRELALQGLKARKLERRHSDGMSFSGVIAQRMEREQAERLDAAVFEERRKEVEERAAMGKVKEEDEDCEGKDGEVCSLRQMLE